MSLWSELFGPKPIKQTNLDKYTENRTILIQEMKKAIGKLLTETRKHSANDDFFDMYLCLSLASKLSSVLDRIYYNEFNEVDAWLCEVKRGAPAAYNSFYNSLPELLRKCHEEK